MVLVPALTWSQKLPPHPYSSPSSTVAFDGYDLTSYFDGKLVKGNAQYETNYDGLKLQFASAQNQSEFLTDPEKYLPAYGGWCAIALTQDSWIRPDYSEYKIQDGKLLFFEVRAFFNGKTAWEKDPDINKIVADRKYKDVVQKP